MLSTGAMTRLGYVYGNLMVNVHLKNEKLVERGVASWKQRWTLQPSHAQAAEPQEAVAKASVRQAREQHCPVALVMIQARLGRMASCTALKSANGNVRQAIALAKTT